MKKTYKVLIVSSEVAPFAKTGGLADVICSLPKALKDLGHDVRVITPQYRVTNERKYILRDVIRLQNIPIRIGDKEHLIQVKSAFIPNSKVQVYFIDDKEYFFREGIYVDPETNTDYPDNMERFLLFCLGSLETLKKLQWQPDVIHCNDWQTGLIPFLLKYQYQQDPFFSKINALFTVHNFSFQGNFSPSFMPLLNLDGNFKFENSPLDFNGQCSFLHAGISLADRINTVSPTYSEEVKKSSDSGFGLEGLLKKKAAVFNGILNGMDDTVWNPEKDPFLSTSFSAEDPAGKIEAKRALLTQTGWEDDGDIPVIAMVSRLTELKGFNLLLESLDDLLDLDCRLIILGTGEKEIEKKLQAFQKKRKAKFQLFLKFDEKLAHMLIAGADLFLMPSLQEPCGLTQMYSLKYGTVPVVHKTGGLADTVRPFDEKSKKGDGFVFDKFKKEELLKSVRKAIRLYQKPDIWRVIMQNGMSQDFSWTQSAQSYLETYQLCVSSS